MASKRVVITGMSAVVADSPNKEVLWANLNAQHFWATDVRNFLERNYQFRSRYYVPAPTIDIVQHGFSGKHRHSMGESASIAVIAAKAAIEDAGYPLEPDGRGGFSATALQNAGVAIGIGLGSIETAIGSYIQHAAHHLEVPELQRFRFHKMVIPITMPNAPAAWISIMLGLKGEAYTVNTACASGNYAIAQACRSIRSGERDVMVTGGVECLKDAFGCHMRGFDVVGALTTSPNGQPQSFSHNRSGFLFSEGGAAMLVLEELERARNRGATIYAEIVDFALNSDAQHIVQLDESGAQIKNLVSGLQRHGKIDYLNAHGTGTQPNEKVESTVIRDVFGGKSSQPYINSTKSIIGHTIGASAAIEAVVTALSIKHQQIHPTLTDNIIDDLNVVVGKPLKTEINHAISVSYSFGGHNSALLLKRFS